MAGDQVKSKFDRAATAKDAWNSDVDIMLRNSMFYI